MPAAGRPFRVQHVRGAGGDWFRRLLGLFDGQGAQRPGHADRGAAARGVRAVPAVPLGPQLPAGEAASHEWVRDPLHHVANGGWPQSGSAREPVTDSPPASCTDWLNDTLLVV
jgi:hypothetical protein